MSTATHTPRQKLEISGRVLQMRQDLKEINEAVVNGQDFEHSLASLKERLVNLEAMLRREIS